MKNSYFMTTDADLMPMTIKAYHEQSYDFNILGPIDMEKRDHKTKQPRLYVALSCIGALFKTWDSLVDESEFKIKHFNGTGMAELMRVKQIEFEKNWGKGKAAWYRMVLQNVTKLA